MDLRGRRRQGWRGGRYPVGEPSHAEKTTCSTDRLLSERERERERGLGWGGHGPCDKKLDWIQFSCLTLYFIASSH
uniref:Uncharacterized protein n=1 Tax=Arundo donax TaxID=35708 RepID=A0A0A9BA50_ARUDO